MLLERKIFWTNLAVGLLGLFVGIDNLLRWYVNFSDTKSFVIGTICSFSAVIWLIITLFLKKTDKKHNNPGS